MMNLKLTNEQLKVIQKFKLGLTESKANFHLWRWFKNLNLALLSLKQTSICD